MKYGRFDEKNHEYIIEKPDTPTPWINYIGSGNYGGIVSNTGGGYSFDRDPRHKRILRYRYNAVPSDQPGRYVYIRDEKSKKYWSATWSPTYTKLEKYECRHGMGYTTIKATYQNIKSRITYFVPGDEALELWVLKVKNTDKKTRKLKLFSYAEFSFYDTLKDQTNVDWCQQINQATFVDDTIFWTAHMKTLGYTFFTTNAKIHSFETDRDKYVGRYRSLANPICVEEGKCLNYLALRGNGVGGLCIELTLKPQEEKEIIFILGTVQNPKEALPLIKKYRNSKSVAESFENLKDYWKNYTSNFQAKTPDPQANAMINLWNQYQCKSTFNWSRFVSLYQLGCNRGMGFRDTSQDTLGVMHTIPKEAKEKIKTLLKIQYLEGCAAHQYYPLTGETSEGDASDGRPRTAKWYSDDHLWIILATCAYLKETGDLDFLNEEVPYIKNSSSGMVLEHLEKAISFSVNHVGKHGLCLAGWADWDDSLNLDTGKGQAESVWTTMLLGVALKEMVELAKAINEPALEKKYSSLHKHFSDIVNGPAGWDGKWYLRAYTDEGKKVGTHENEFAKIYLLVQSWPVMAGFATEEKAKTALKSAHEILNTKYGLILIYPAYKEFDWKIGGTTTYPPGAKENGGIFLQTNPWQMIAQTIVGNGDLAYQYYKQILPSSKNGAANLYEVEPYVYCQNILGKEHPQFGLGRNSWLTGTAAWAFVAVSQYILGIKPEYNGLRIDPCIPKEWNGFEVKRIFRGVNYFITVRNPKHVSKGVKSLTINGEKIDGNLIPHPKDKKDQNIEAILG